MDLKHHPPRWANRFLEWYCRPDLLEEIQGDVHELFYRKAGENRRVANWQFVWNVIRFFRLKNISKKKITSPSMMLQNYLRTGFRNALRNSVTSFINVGGLAVGVAGAITIFIFADQFFHTDDFQKKADRIHLVTDVVNRDSRQVILSDVPLLLGPSMQQDFPEIEKVVRVELGSASVRNGDRVFSEQVYFADNTFFDVFNYPMIEGNDRALHDKKNIVITKAMAEKYFGDQSALGQTVSLKFSNNQVVEFHVGAVVDQPANNTMYFKFLVSMDVFTDLKLKDAYDWTYLTDATFILLKPGHGTASLEKGMSKYKKLQNESSPEWLIEDFIFYPFTSMPNRSYEIESALVGSGHPQGIYAMATIAGMLLLLACFNYMNISVATISTRLKEIGVRKVIGSNKREIILQFVTENFLMCGFALAIGLLIAYFFFMPWLVSLLTYDIPFAFSSGKTGVLFFVGLLLLIILVSGVYPAVYVSGFQPVTILKGKEKFGQRSRFSRVMLTVQFIIAFTTIVGCFVFIDNALYLKNKDWGYDHHQNIVVPVQTDEQYLQLRDLVSSQQSVVSHAGSANHIGHWNTRSSVVQQGERFEIVSYQVGFNYLETMNLRLKEGRSFDASITTDKIESVVVNENFVKEMKWKNAVGQVFEYDSIKRTVIGVVQNFHYDDFYRGILPVMFSIVPDSTFSYLSLKVRPGEVAETEATLREIWKKIAPDDPYEGELQDDVFSNFRQNTKTEIRLLSFIAGIALILACLGLFGLVSYNITRRMKEFSVRRVFGASAWHVFRMMNRDYVWILSIAFIVGAPTGFFLMDTLIQHIYTEPQHAGPVPFVIAISLMLATVAITIGTQLTRVTRENPTDTLRIE